MKSKKNKEGEFIHLVEKTTQKDSLDGFSELVEKETKLDLNQSKKAVQEISDTIDTISENFDFLRKAKESGKTRTQWFKEKLDETIEKNKIKDTETLITEIKEGLQSSNTKIGIEMFGEKLDISKPLTSSKYENLNKTAIVNDFQEEIKNNTLLSALSFEKEHIKIDKNHKEIKAVKDYFEDKLDSPKDKTLKKAIATATTIAQEKKLLPKNITGKTPSELAMMVDRGVTTAKVAYKLGKGELSPVDAVEYTIDRSVSVLNSAVTTTCTRAGGSVGGKLGGVIGSVFGPAGTAAGAAIGTVLGKVGGYVIGKFIGEGMKKIASVVKTVAKKAWEGIKSIARALNPFNWFS